LFLFLYIKIYIYSSILLQDGNVFSSSVIVVKSCAKCHSYSIQTSVLEPWEVSVAANISIIIKMVFIINNNNFIIANIIIVDSVVIIIITSTAAANFLTAATGSVAEAEKAVSSNRTETLSNELQQ